MTIGGVFAELGKDLLRTAFPEVYSNVSRYRSILSRRGRTVRRPETETPLIRAIHDLNRAVDASNDIATDSLEAILVQNDLLEKILKKGIGGRRSVFDWLKDLIPHSVGGAVVEGGAIVAGAAILKKYFSRLATRFKGGVKFFRAGSMLSGLIRGMEEYSATGNAGKSLAIGGGSMAGAWAGAEVGAAAGTFILPGVGTVIGGIGGSMAGGYLGSQFAGSGYDMITGGQQSGMDLLNAGIINYKANEILLKAQDIILNAKNLVQPKVGSGTLGTATTTGSGTAPVFRPGVGGNQGQRSAREPYIPRKPGETGAVSESGKEVPPAVLEDAKQLLEAGGDSNDVRRFMAQQGYDMRGNWCGEFAAAVVKSAGGTPPKNASIATNWLNYGQPVDPKDVKPGDVAVLSRGRGSGQTGGHVGFVYSRDERGGFRLLGGNQGRAVSGNQSMQGYEFRRPVEASPSRPEESPPPAQTTSTTPQPPASPSSPSAASQTPSSPPSPTSYKVDMPQVLKAIRSKNSLAGFASDDMITSEMTKRLAHDHPNTKFEKSILTGSKSDIDSIEAGFKQEGMDVSKFIQPVDAQPKVVPMPVIATDPSIANIKTERDKLKKDVTRLKKKSRETDPKDEVTKMDDSPPPKDNERSDRALFNINPQLHDDRHPQ